MDWNKIWTSITSFFTNNFWNIVIWFAVLFIGVIVVKIMLNIIRKIMNKTKMEKVTQSFLYNIVKFLFYLVLILILLNMIGVEMTGILTTISALLLAVGMALQSNISNLANGIVLVTTLLVKKGDFI